MLTVDEKIDLMRVFLRDGHGKKYNKELCEKALQLTELNHIVIANSLLRNGQVEEVGDGYNLLLEWINEMIARDKDKQ